MTSPTPPDPADRFEESDVCRRLTFEEEVEEMLHAPRGQPLSEIVAEFEQRSKS